jgi:hypothetical protein
MDLVEIGLGAFDWIGLAQDKYRWRALVNAIMNLRVYIVLGNNRVVPSCIELVISKEINLFNGKKGMRTSILFGSRNFTGLLEYSFNTRG